MKRLVGVALLAFALAGLPLGGASAATQRASDAIPPMPTAVESWVAYFHLAEHVVTVGKFLHGEIEIPPIGDCGQGHRCVTSVSVSGGNGLEQIGPCDLKHRFCTWKAIGEADPWQTVSMDITTAGMDGAVSNDNYMVVDPNTYVLDGNVWSPTSSKGAGGVTVRAVGKHSGSAVTNGDGYYVMRLKKGYYTVTPKLVVAGKPAHFRPARARVQVKRHGSNVQNFWLRPEFPSLLSGLDKNNQQVANGGRIGAVGDTVGFTGGQWDPLGDPISVYWGKSSLSLEGGSSQTSFGGHFTLPTFPTDKCVNTLSAVQGEIRKSLVLHANVDGKVGFAKGPVQVGVWAGDHVTPASGARKATTNSALCDNEGAVIGQGGVAVWANSQGGQLENAAEHLHVWGQVTTGHGSMPLAGGGRASFALAGADPHSFDPSNRPSVQALQASYSQDVTLSGWSYAANGLTITGSLFLDGGLLYVNGNLTVTGGAHGVGAIIATGNITITGPIDLKTDVKQAIDAGGTLTLNGGG